MAGLLISYFVLMGLAIFLGVSRLRKKTTTCEPKTQDRELASLEHRLDVIEEKLDSLLREQREHSLLSSMVSFQFRESGLKKKTIEEYRSLVYSTDFASTRERVSLDDSDLVIFSPAQGGELAQ